MEIGKMTISEAEPYLESIAIFYGLELNRVKDFKIARMILASIYSNDTL
jgi:hypothetical protein